MKIRFYQNAFGSPSSLEELKIALKNCLHQLGITTFAFTYYAHHPLSKNKLKFDFCSSNLTAWHKHYIEESYETIDSTLTEVYQSPLPVFWNLAAQLKTARSPKEKQMRLDGIAYGAVQGLSIPIHGPNDDFAILLVTQMKGESSLENWQELQDELMILAKCFYSSVQKLIVIDLSSGEKYQLSDRELQCILLTAKKKSVTEIAHFLDIKERTVNFHLQSANKKLGVHNKYQSVAKAIQKGIITL